ncbi:hypothetical protein D3C87_2186170 [compost metagenome]
MDSTTAKASPIAMVAVVELVGARLLLHASCGAEMSSVTSALRANVEVVLPVMAITRFF